MAATILSSFELGKIMAQARERAQENEKPVTSLNVLAAMLSVRPNQCAAVLEQLKLKLQVKPEEAREAERAGWKVVANALGALLREEGEENLVEPDDTLRVIHSKACELSQAYRSQYVNSLFYLMAMCRVRRSLAHRVLVAAKVDLSQLWTAVLGRVSTLPTQEDNLPVQVEPGGEVRPVPAAVGSAEAAAKPAAARAAGGDAAGVRPRPPDPVAVSLPSSPAVVSSGPRPAAPAAEGAAAPAATGDPARYELDPAEFPLLTAMARNVTLDAATGRIDPCIGRRKEIEQIIEILRKRKVNNPCLVGDPGVGKTAMVEGLALEIVGGKPGTEALRDSVILEVNVGALVAGTELRGAFQQRMLDLQAEVRKGGRRFIVFMDEIHTLVGAGGGESALDAANQLKTSLARGDFPCVGATTLKEYKQYIEKDPALERRFVPVYVKEPEPDEALGIIEGVVHLYEATHGVKYARRALEAAVRLSSRYMMDRKLPAKAIDILDTAGARASVGRRLEVTEEDVAHVIARKVGIPIERLHLTAESRFGEMERHLARMVVGHGEVLARVCEALRRGLAGFSGGRPLASFLFLGPTGVGKTQTARALSSFLFDRRDATLDFNMGEFTEKHAVAKLIGTGPGYVGHEEGGRLTEALHRRSFQILVFRDVLLAHPDVQDLLAQALRVGTLTDGKGRRVYFSNAVMILTHDVEPGLFLGGDARRVGFAASDAAADLRPDADCFKELERRSPSDLFHAVDERFLFRPLTDLQARQVVRLEAADRSRSLQEERNIRFELTDRVVDRIISQGGYAPKTGGSLVKQVLARTVESFLASEVLSGAIRPGQLALVDWDGAKFTASVQSA